MRKEAVEAEEDKEEKAVTLISMYLHLEPRLL
jgi:hypothetical protein